MNGMPGNRCRQRRLVRNRENSQLLEFWPGLAVGFLTCGLLFVPSEHLQLLLQVPDVEQLAEVIAGCRQKPVPVQVPLHLHHCILVGMAKEKDAGEPLVAMVMNQPGRGVCDLTVWPNFVPFWGPRT